MIFVCLFFFVLFFGLFVFCLFVLFVFCLFVVFFSNEKKGGEHIRMMLSENNGSIKFTYKFIFWGEMEGADNDDAVSHLKSLNKF